uniref:Uncharacterized protein n=1 Tax=Anguilla anguilla TaxID=7936 RepID=A0A0E9V519_ANGAN
MDFPYSTKTTIITKNNTFRLLCLIIL